MRILQLNGKMIISERESYDIYTTRSRLITNLNNRYYKTDFLGKKIVFKQKSFIAPSGYPDLRYKVIRALREGYIDIDKQTNCYTISWSAKLNNLLFIACCFGILVILFASCFLNTTLFFSIISGIIFILVYLITGISFIRSRLNSIIYHSVYFN
jgi:hypothetical protein